MSETENGQLLVFAAFESSVDDGFWHKLSSLKIEKLKTDESRISITGFYTPCSKPIVPSTLTLDTDSLPTDLTDEQEVGTSHGDRNKCLVPGTLYNTNTLEGFQSLDKQALIRAEAKKIWDDIRSGKAEEDSSVPSRFLLISFADLKIFNFFYWFAFPGLVLPATLVGLPSDLSSLLAI